MASKELHIGFDRKDKKKPILLPVSALKRHFAALGASGSGKTVLVKCVMEECIRAGIPLLMVDLQGDLASLALMGDKELAKSKGTPGEYWDEIKNKAQVAIYTPASSKGIPISMNPLKAPPDNLDPEDFIQAVDSVAETIASVIGYNTDKGKGADVKNYLYLLLEAIWTEGDDVKSFGTLAKNILNDSKYLDESGQAMLEDKDKQDLAKKVRGMTIGSESLLFNLGMPLDVERMMTWHDKGKVPVNVIYLNTLRSQEDKVNFIADIANQVYSWMLRNPSEDVQLVFVLDELAGLVPPIRNPPSKKSIQLLLKQARKYGVSLLLATQNISDVDYKSLGQVSTWALGKLIAKQDIEKVKDIISAISPAETDEILSILPKQKAGQFMLLNPDVYDSVQRIQARWLVTNHTTLDDSKVQEIMDETGIRSKFPDAKGKEKRKSKRTKADGSPLAASEAKEAGIADAPTVSDDPSAIPASADAIVKEMDKRPLTMTVEEYAAASGVSKKEAEKKLKKMVSDKKFVVQEIDGEKVFWSKKHKMDPKNNIVGPLFGLQNKFAQSKAEKIMKSNMDKSFGKLHEEIKRINLQYIPLWRIGVIRHEKKGFLFKKEVEIEEFYYVNALDGSLLIFDDKKDQVNFKKRDIDPEEVETLPNDLKLISITLDDLDSEYLKPKISREKAKKLVTRYLAYPLNLKTVPSLVWYPIWEFYTEDKNVKNKSKEAWVDGVFGSYILIKETSPY